MKLIAFGTCQLKYIRILLMRHDTGAGRELIRQFDEAKVLAIEHTSVER